MGRSRDTTPPVPPWAGAGKSRAPAATAVSGGPAGALFATVLLLLAAACPRPAGAAHNPAWLAELIERGRFQEAYEVASAHLPAHAGELDFDFYYALAAIETGHLGEAIFALERMLIQAPGLDRARLELARALFLQGDDLRARREFETVLAHDPPQAVAVRIQRYLAAMDRRADRYRTTVTGWLEAELGEDSNANRAPDTETIDLTFGTLVLSETQQERDAAFLRAAGAVQLSRPLRPGLNLIGAVGGEARSFDGESEFDTRLAHGRVGLRRTEGPHQVTGLVQTYTFYVDGEDYQDALGLAGSYVYEVNDDTAFNVSARLTDLQYDDAQDVRDSQLALVGVGVSRSWLGRFNPSASISLLIGDEDPDDNSVQARALASRDIRGLQGWVGITPAPNWSLQGRLLYRNSEYETNTFPFAEARDEDYYAVDVALDWHPSAYWRVGPHLDYSENDANIDLYDYDRLAVGVRARYSFY